MTDEIKRANKETQKIWDANAVFWDERMGEGNDFVNILSWPAVERLLELKEGDRILDIACGNGMTSRRLANMGADVVAFDFSKEMIKYARARTQPHSGRIEYLVADGTNDQELIRLGEKRFDGAICHMALFDMADISPLLRALSRLLKPLSPFVFALIHPCFNNRGMAHVAEMEELDGEFVTRYAVKIRAYMTPSMTPGIAIHGQSQQHLYFHRPLQELFGACFKEGFVLDGFEECAFPSDYHGGTTPLSWSGNFSEIPPVLVARMRLPGSKAHNM